MNLKLFGQINFEEALVILDTALKQQGLNDIQELIFRQSWEGQTYLEMAESSGYDANYIKDVGSKLWKLLSKAFEEEVTKSNFRSVLRRQYIASQHTTLSSSIDLEDRVSIDDAESIIVNSQTPKTDWLRATPNFENAKVAPTNTLCDWGEAVDVSAFYGRTEELNILKQWIVDDRCRLVALLGMGGIGKTTLSVSLAEQNQNNFEYVIWRSLLHAPPVEEILANLIQLLSNQKETEADLPKDVDGRISLLIDYLRSSRCLLVLDNAETILRGGDRAGQYREGYSGYGELFRRIGEARHQSCLVLTSREKPKEFLSLEGETLPVRSLQLTGLKSAEAREIFRIKGSFSGSESEWRGLIEHYAGNPLVLKIVAAAIQDLFDNSVSKFLEFLDQGTLVLDDIRVLLEWQFNRLSDLEKEIMYWLAIEREPITLSELRENISSLESQQKLPEALLSLCQRSLIEKNSASFTQKPVVMDYITNKLIEQVCSEITTGEIAIFNSHALLNVQGKDYVKDAQIRLILKPVTNKLLTVNTKKNLGNQLTQILSTQRDKSPGAPGYAGVNVLNMLRQLKTDFSSNGLASTLTTKLFTNSCYTPAWHQERSSQLLSELSV